MKNKTYYRTYDRIYDRTSQLYIQLRKLSSELLNFIKKTNLKE